MQGLDNLRRVAGLMGEGGPSAGRLGGLVQGQIDQFVNGLSPADIVGATDPAAAAASLNSARSAWQTYSKASDLDNAVAGARAKGDMALIPGSTVDAATRNAVARLRDSRASWSPDSSKRSTRSPKGRRRSGLWVVGALAPNSPITALMHAGGLIGGLATGGVGTAGLYITRNDGDGASGQSRGEQAHGKRGRFAREFDPLGWRCSPTAAPSVFPRVASPLSAALVNSLFPLLRPSAVADRAWGRFRSVSTARSSLAATEPRHHVFARHRGPQLGPSRNIVRYHVIVS